MKLFLLFNLLNYIFGILGSSLQQLHVLFRHGDRSPTDTYENDPHKNYIWPGGLGYLTNEGKWQMYALGENLRQHYKQFVPKYLWHEDVNFTSSYADRCLASAELVGAGMFPPKDEQIWNNDLLWQPIPIHYLPRNMDNLVAMKAACKNYDEIFQEVYHNSPKMLEINKENENLYKYLSEHTGMVVDNIGTVESLFNTLEIEQIHNLTLPSWVNDTILQTMKELGALNLAFYSETQFMKRMKGGVFLKHVIESMKKSINEEKQHIIKMYSGHDLTIVHVLRSLNLIDTLKPEYGACIVFELYSDSEVKIFYWKSWQGGIEEKITKSCQSPCLLQELEKSLEEMLPYDWNEECKSNKTNF